MRPSTGMQLTWTMAAVFTGSMLSLGLDAQASGLRAGLTPMKVQAPSHDLATCDLIVKFKDASRVRAFNGRLLSLTAADLAPIQTLLDASDATVKPRIKMSESAMQEATQRARLRSGRPQPDMAGILTVQVAPDKMVALAQALNARHEVEIVQIVAPPVNTDMPCNQTDFPPPTPDFRMHQTYRGTAAEGGVRLAEARVTQFIDVDEDGAEGIFGEGVAIGDVEQCYLTDHEDLCFIMLEPGQTPACPTGPDHGTAVLGVMGAIEDTDASEPNIGMGGLAPMSDYWFFPAISLEENVRIAAAIMSATMMMPSGSILLIEQQRTAYPQDPFGDPFVIPFVPAETSFDVWLATRLACDAGIVVVAAAGNGTQDLDGGEWVGPDDSPTFFQYYGFYLGWGDSGAIMVGGGSSNADHDRLGFSTFGSRIDMQGWGENVATLGYGDLLPVDGLVDDRQFYTTSFSGTSSATPIVAGVAAMLQGLRLEIDDEAPYSSEEMRDLLVNTGRDAGAGWLGEDAPAWATSPPFPDAYAGATAVLDGDVGPQYGACCMDDNTCMLVDVDLADNCWLVGGAWRGAGTVCADHCGNSGEFIRLIYPGAADNDQIGSAIKMTDAGDYAAVLAPSFLRIPPNPMRLIYAQHPVNGWELDSQLPGSTGDTSISIHRDGADTLLAGVGSILELNSEGDRTGTATVYRRLTNGVWESEAALFPDLGDPSGLFGTAVELGDSLALVGDCGWTAENLPGDVEYSAGRQVHIFTRSPLRVWSESDMVAYPGPQIVSSRFGDAIAMAGDLVFVGAPQHGMPEDDYLDVGAVYMYRLNGDNLDGFSLSPVDEDGDGAPDQLMPHTPVQLGYFGEAIDAAEMADGTIRVAVGFPGIQMDSVRQGCIEVYDIDPTTMSITQMDPVLPTTLGAGDRFGSSVDLDADGLLLTGGTDRGQTEEGQDTGFCWAWHWRTVGSSSDWREIVRLQSRFPGNGDRVGASVAIGVTADGSTQVLAGAPGAVGSLEDSGAVLVWDSEFVDCDVDGIHDQLAIAQGIVDDIMGDGGAAGPDGIPDDCNAMAAADRSWGDCNEDGIPDWVQDIVDVNGNGRDDACDKACFSQWSCPADTRNGDGVVGRDDLLAVLEYWGADASDSLARRCDIWPGAGPSVLDGDGEINVLDLITVIRSWGACDEEVLSDSYCFTLDVNSDGEVDVVFPGYYR
ncbi:MAG: S8 family serine peptidase [Phycisphaerales bacterium]|nr:S8 family serine peptidase [Phycisphaerales bacterium]